MGRIRRRVAAVLRFLDTVTQTPVPGGGLTIQIRQKCPIIRKDDGCVVILAQPGVDSLDIDVTGGSFAPVAVHLDLAETVRVEYIYLLPSRGYPFAPRMAVLSGTCAARAFYAVRTADGDRYRLMENLSAGGDVIKIWGIERFLQGQQLLLKEEERYALVTLLEPDDGSERGYRIRERVLNDFRKGKTKVYSAIRVVPDGSGRFCFAYDRIRGEKETIRLLGEHIFQQGKEAGEEKETDMEIEIREGQEMEIHVGG